MLDRLPLDRILYSQTAQKTKPLKTSASKLPLSTKILYGVGYLPDSIMNNTFYALVFLAYNLHWGLAAALVGWAGFYSRIWEAFIDPFFGNMSDKCRSRWGRRRPFMFVGAVLGGVACAALWSPPASVISQHLYIYLIVVTILYFTAYAVYSVPFMAFGLGLASGDEDRTSLAGYRVAANCFVLAVVVPVLPLLVYYREGAETSSLAYVGYLLGGLILVSGVMASLMVKEPALPTEQITPSHKPAETHSLIDGFKYTVTNVPFLMVTGIVAFTIIGLSSAMTNSFFLNLAVVCPGDKKTAGELALVTGVIGAVAGFLITFALPNLSARFGRRRLLLTSLVGMIVAFLVSPWLFTAKMPYLQVVFHVIVQMSVTSVWVLTFPMLADVCDYDEIRTGVRREGVYTAMYNWGCKVAIAMIGVVSGAILDFSGFNEKLALQSERTSEILRWSFALVPLPFFIGCIVLTVLFPLNAQRLQRMREERARAY